MKKSIALLMVVVLLALGCACAAAETLRETTTIELDENGMSITLPMAWMQMPVDDAMKETGTLLMASNENFTLIFQITLTRGATDTLKALRSMLSDVEGVTKLKDVKIGESELLAYQMQSTACYLAELSDGSIVNFTFVCLDENELDEEAFMEIVGSFELSKDE